MVSQTCDFGLWKSKTSWQNKGAYFIMNRKQREGECQVWDPNIHFKDWPLITYFLQLVPTFENSHHLPISPSAIQHLHKVLKCLAEHLSSKQCHDSYNRYWAESLSLKESTFMKELIGTCTFAYFDIIKTFLTVLRFELIASCLLD
jgi:hypothetical protein